MTLKHYCLNFAAAIAMSIALAACTPEQQYAQYNDANIINFSEFGITRLDVAKVTIDDTYIPPLRSPNVEHEFHIPLYQAVHRWAENRFQAVGTGGEAHLVIKDASVRRERTKGDMDKYVARIEARLVIDSPYYAPEAFAEVVVTQTSTLSENASDSARAEFYDKIDNQLIQTLNVKMTESVQKNLYPLIR